MRPPGDIERKDGSKDEDFLMRASARFRLGATVARVGKSLREEAAGAGRCLWGKCVGGWVCGCCGGVAEEDWYAAASPFRRGVCLGFNPGAVVLRLLRDFPGRCVHKGVWPVWLRQPVCNGWDERALGHAACFLGGARDRGTSPRRNVSMMRIVPPQSGHGSRRVSGAGFTVGRSVPALVRLPRSGRGPSRYWPCAARRPAGRSGGCGGSHRAERASGSGG